MLASGEPDAEEPTWRPYDARGTRSRVRAFLVAGAEEFELCAEGGLLVIRRTIRRKGRPPLVLETSRGRVRDTEEVWETLSRFLEAGRRLPSSPEALRRPQSI